MQAVAKTHHTEDKTARPGVILRFRQKTPPEIIKHIAREYGDYLIDADDDELVVWEETDLARKINARMTPGKYLKNLREATGMTQKVVGEKIGVCTNHVSDYETGQRAISRFTAKKLAEVFGVSAGVFI